MKLSRLSAVERMIILIAIIMVIGGGVSIALTTNPDWTSLHLSRLGEGGRVSSYIFNATAAFSGLAMLGLGAELMRAQGWEVIPKKARYHGQIVLHTAFRLIAICLIGLSIFPYDKFVAVHNTFGYGMTIIYLVAVAYVTYSIPLFSQAFMRVTGVFLCAMLGLFAFYFLLNGRQITLLEVQILGLVFFFVWLLQLSRRLQPRSSKLAQNNVA